MPKPQITYITDLAQDIDDIIAASMLHKLNLLTYLVCNPHPTDTEGIHRLYQLRQQNINITPNIPDDTNIIFVGGSLTKTAEFLENHKINTLIINGGFVGNNIIPNKRALPKFKNHTTMRTYNFNIDVHATDYVLQSDNIERIILVGKNVCHDPQNTKNGIWSTESLLSDFNIKPNKRLHDLLMIIEGAIRLNLINSKPHCNFKTLYPFNTGLNGNMTQWGTCKSPTQYRSAEIATTWITNNLD
jgi:hypothetical protein